MRQLLKLLRVPSFNSKGFTLIELLVVIGILGILASALVATIDPFEQLKKGQDAKLQNIAVEFYNANLRYYTTHNNLPWDVSTTEGGCVGAGTSLTADALTAIDDCLDVLVNEGELKAGFTTVVDDLEKIFISETGNQMIVCFQPQSKSQRAATNAKYNADGTETGAATACPDSDSADCHWCTR